MFYDYLSLSFVIIEFLYRLTQVDFIKHDSMGKYIVLALIWYNFHLTLLASKIFVTTGSVNGLLPDGTMLLPKPMSNGEWHLPGDIFVRSEINNY